ncbi:MAG: hypothetical protein RBU37_12785 [Myxococcota bacterium]|jgi:hypothetical protein|nr:hypothetical protein [Myxococcota bacterium]
MTEAVGYLASVLTAASFMMTNVWRLRWLSVFGCVAFLVYGSAVGAWPVVVVNAFIAVINLYFLRKLSSKKHPFSLLHTQADAPILRLFLERYGQDAASFFPNFALEAMHPERARFVLILHELKPIGLFIFEREGCGNARIHLDYVSPDYRNLASARFLFDDSYRVFIEDGIRELEVRDTTPAHAGYCRRMGFVPSLLDPKVFVKTLAAAGDMARTDSSTLRLARQFAFVSSRAPTSR